MNTGTFNVCIFSGYVAADGDTAVNSAGGQMMLFPFVVIDEAGERVPLKMRLEGAGFAAWGGMITRGRAAFLHCHAKNVPIRRHDVIRGETTVFVVDHAEFQNRTKAAVEAETEAAA